MYDWTKLPESLPVPQDDGGARHLPGLRLPVLTLPATDGRDIDLSSLKGLSVVFCYPRTGSPHAPNLPGWDEIPGARGCTPQACGFRDFHADLTQHGVSHVFGLSTQEIATQREVADRLHLPFPLLSDHGLALAHALTLPTFTVADLVLLKRLTLLITDQVITHVFYPVFPPDRSAEQVLDYLKAHSSR